MARVGPQRHRRKKEKYCPQNSGYKEYSLLRGAADSVKQIYQCIGQTYCHHLKYKTAY